MDDDYEVKMCDICGESEAVMLIGVEGVPWAFNICSADGCESEAEEKLERALENLEEQEARQEAEK